MFSPTAASPKPYVSDANEQNFQQRVLERSATVPVIVDFWAPWCEPCKTLGPLLEQLAAEWGGAFELVKVDVEQNPRLAQAFRVQSIPLVYAFDQGQPVDGFQGAVTPAEVRKFLERLVPPPKRNPLDVAKEALADGDNARAQQHFQLALADKPESAAEAHLGLARIALVHRDAEAAKAHLDQIKADDPLSTQVQRLRGILAFSVDAGKEEDLLTRLSESPNDVSLFYALGATFATQLRYEDALDAFLRVVMLDRAFREDAGRKAMLCLFDLVGTGSEVSVKYRKRLAACLF